MRFSLPCLCFGLCFAFTSISLSAMETQFDTDTTMLPSQLGTDKIAEKVSAWGKQRYLETASPVDTRQARSRLDEIDYHVEQVPTQARLKHYQSAQKTLTEIERLATQQFYQFRLHELANVGPITSRQWRLLASQNSQLAEKLTETNRLIKKRMESTSVGYNLPSLYLKSTLVSAQIHEYAAFAYLQLDDQPRAAEQWRLAGVSGSKILKMKKVTNITGMSLESVYLLADQRLSHAQQIWTQLALESRASDIQRLRETLNNNRLEQSFDKLVFD